MHDLLIRDIDPTDAKRFRLAAMTRGITHRQLIHSLLALWSICQAEAANDPAFEQMLKRLELDQTTITS